MGKMREAQKLGLPPRYLRKGSRCFCVPVSEEINNISDVVLAEDILQQQELTAEGRFRCRFPRCNKSFKYSGKTRRNLLHFRPRDVLSLFTEFLSFYSFTFDSFIIIVGHPHSGPQQLLKKLKVVQFLVNHLKQILVLVGKETKF